MARVYLDKRTGWWCLDYLDAQGRRKRIRGARTRVLAESLLRKSLDDETKVRITGIKAIKPMRLDELAKEYIVHSHANKKPSSARRDEVIIKNLLSSFSGKLLTGINSQEIEQYQALRSASAAKATVNREIACLKNMFTKAIQWGYASSNPAKEVKLFKENNTRVRYLAPNERKLLLARCGEHIRPIVITALNTGMRKSEILNLKWADIDFNLGLITIRDTKNNEPRHISMNETLIETIQSVTKCVNSPYVFCNDKGKHYGDIKKGFAGVLKRAGISDFRFHDLRHDFASCLVMAGVDIRTIQELMGHKSIEMTLRYAHLSPDHTKAAVNRLDDYTRGQKPVRDGTYLAQDKICGVTTG